MELVEVPTPQPKVGELLIEVHAAALNRTDIVTREGKSGYAVNPILGVEVAGIVTEVKGECNFSVWYSCGP